MSDTRIPRPRRGLAPLAMGIAMALWSAGAAQAQEAAPVCNSGPGGWTCVGPTGTAPGARTETQFFAGLQWNFGTSAAELVGGVRRTRTSADNDVTGVKADVALPLGRDILSPKVRLLALGGSRLVQAELGGGFDFAAGSPVISGGVQLPYVNGGANYVVGSGVQPYVGVNSLQRPPSGKGKLGCGSPEFGLFDVDNLLRFYPSRPEGQPHVDILGPDAESVVIGNATCAAYSDPIE